MIDGQSRQRVLAALSFEQPDILPLFESYWPEFIDQWRMAKESPQADEHAVNDHYGNDVLTAAADESPWPSKKGPLEASEPGPFCEAQGREDRRHSVSRSGWGSVSRTVEGGYFSEELSVALEERVDPDRLVFESPYLEGRYEQSDAAIRTYGARYAVFAKTGGPFKRPSWLRGYEQFLVDLAQDAEWVRALVERVMDHLIAVGVEQLRRNGPSLAGIQINDDCCSLRGPLMSPRTYERVCLPSLTKMIHAYKEAGAIQVYLHCDGNPMPLVEMWVDAGIDAIHPCEPRAGVDVFALRRIYGEKLAFIGAMDNCHILPQGSRAEIYAHIGGLSELGREGGLILGGHSIGPDISVERYEWAMAARQKHGVYNGRI